MSSAGRGDQGLGPEGRPHRRPREVCRHARRRVGDPPAL